MTGKAFRTALKEFFEGRWQIKAAETFDVHPATIRRWCARRRIPKIAQLAFERLVIMRDSNL